jgi:hypothetical protein
MRDVVHNLFCAKVGIFPESKLKKGNFYRQLSKESVTHYSAFFRFDLVFERSGKEIEDF